MTIATTSMQQRLALLLSASIKSYWALHWKTTRSKLLPTQICHNSVFVFTAQAPPVAQVCISTSTATSLPCHSSLHTFLAHNLLPSSPVKICTPLTQMPFRDSPSSDAISQLHFFSFSSSLAQVKPFLLTDRKQNSSYFHSSSGWGIEQGKEQSEYQIN